MNLPAFTALDFETTGMVRGFQSLPWQLGAVTLRDGHIDTDGPSFDTLIRVPETHRFSPHAPGTYRSRRPEIAQAPEFHVIWPTLHDCLTRTVPVAHNAATERGILRAFAPMTAYPRWVDTLRLARRIWPGLPSYALGDLIALLGLGSRLSEIVPGREAHDAYYDAVACGLLLEYILTLPGWRDAELDDLVNA